MKVECTKIWKWFVGFVIYLVLGWICRWLITLQLLIPRNIISWLSESKSPTMALWLFSYGITALVLIGIHTGVKFPLIQRNKHWLWDYILGLSLGKLIFFSVCCFIGLVLLQPQCGSPAIAVRMLSSDEQTVLSSENKVKVQPNSNFILEAKSIDGSIIICKWTYVGEMINGISPQSSCTTNVSLSNQTGEAMITLSASPSFCSTTSTYPIQLISP